MFHVLLQLLLGLATHYRESWCFNSYFENLKNHVINKFLLINGSTTITKCWLYFALYYNYNHVLYKCAVITPYFRHSYTLYIVCMYIATLCLRVLGKFSNRYRSICLLSATEIERTGNWCHWFWQSKKECTLGRCIVITILWLK